jgi:hypothetical protein
VAIANFQLAKINELRELPLINAFIVLNSAVECEDII